MKIGFTEPPRIAERNKNPLKGKQKREEHEPPSIIFDFLIFFFVFFDNV